MVGGTFWSAGTSETLSEDSLFLLRLRSSGGEMAFAAVLDGIGGLSQGEIASGFLAERLQTAVFGELGDYLNKGKWEKAKKAAYRCFYDTARSLAAYGKANGIQLGTTLTFAYLKNGRYTTFHLGDSRVYRVGKQGARCLFADDAKEGRLMACMGSMQMSMPHTKEGRLLKGQGLLLCSDGFYRGLSEKELCQALGSLQRGKGSEAVDKRLAALAERALERGSMDHISAAFILNQDDPFL